MQGGREQRVAEGVGVTVAISFCPVLNPVVPVQRTCLFRGKMCVAVLNVGSQTGDKALARLADCDSLS